jgi:hypothetical protein
MKSLGIVFVVACALLFAFTSCDKRPAAKFQPGDIVVVKATREEGRVCLRARFLRDDQYFVTLPGSSDVFVPIRDREESAAAWAAYVAKYGPPPFGAPRTSHEEGPFYESELERTH